MLIQPNRRVRAQVELLTFVNGRSMTAIVWLPLTPEVRPTATLLIDGQGWMVRRILEGPYQCQPRESLMRTKAPAPSLTAVA